MLGGIVARIRQVRVDQACRSSAAHLNGVAALADAVKHLGVAEREGHVKSLAGADLGGIEDGVDQSLPGARR
jgi:hypothetical protein